MLDSINNQSGLLRQLIEDILQLSRLDAGVTEADRQALDLRAVLTQTVADLRPLAEAKQIALEWQQPAGPVMTLGDPELIERLARNLIDNAVKYTPAGGTVKVETEFKVVRNQLLALIQVTDTGIGIPLEHQAQIFNRFHRVDPYDTTAGTGLGLSIVKEIVNAHQGNIQLESKPGVGTTFVVSLPGLAEQ
jgi:signal transduction histidine kinase